MGCHGVSGALLVAVAHGLENRPVFEHGIVEVFADGGAAVLSAQVFAGPSPVVTVG